MIRRLLALLLPLLVLAGCQERELPTALAPEGPLFDHVGASYVVSNTNDSGEGSLRYAIEHIEAGGTITFAAALGGQSIPLTSGELTIAKDLTITGPGANQLTVSGNNSSRVFRINDGRTVTLSGLTITGGSASHGGGIVNQGTLTLTHSTVVGNGAGWAGGGIYNIDGTLTLTNSTVSGNSATDGGGIFNDEATLTLTNSTVSGNSAREGGGIWSFGWLTLTHSTVSGNSADVGGGIANLWSGTATLRNTIVANSPSGGNCTGTITDGGYNLEGGDGTTATTSCGFSGTSQSVADAKLGPLALHAPGTTATHALQVGSPAVDAGTCTDHEANAVTTDQRGVSRPQPSGGTCDIGAFELEQASAPVFGGFLPPMREGQLNVMKAGRAVPLKFSLGGDFGLDIFAAVYPTTVRIDCPAPSVTRNTVGGTTTARESRLSYDLAADQYSYLWVTQKGWAGTCRQFQLQLRNGNTYTLDVSFTR